MSSLLELEWKRDRQWFAIDGERFSHEGETATTVAHDLCHLVVAANGGLEWRPEGEDAAIRRAEFNAVYLEWIYHGVYERMTAGRPLGRGLLARAREHSKDFVQRYYAPFPTTFARATRDFHEAIDPELVARLYPAYVNAYLMEKLVRAEPFPAAVLRFRSDARPPWSDRGPQELRAALELARLPLTA